MRTALFARLVSVRRAPFQALLIATLTSYGGLALATLQGWPPWAAAAAALAPWAPAFALLTHRAARLDAWLALFLVLAVSQTGHLVEHVAQMVQVHLLDLRGVQARGIVGTLDIEWVHFIWNTWVLLAVVVLLGPYRRNRWLWLAALLAGWHEVEHAYIMSVFLRTGTAGTPGLLAEGGALLGGLPLSRPDLHFLYNLLETAPLLCAFFVEARRARPAVVGRRLRRRPIARTRRADMSGGDAILLHAIHAGRGFDGWLLLLPPAPAAALGLTRLAIRLWPAIHRRFHSPAEPV